MLPPDTSREAWVVFLQAQRRLTPAEKFRQAAELSTMVTQAAEGDLRMRYPQARPREIFLRAARQRSGPELFALAYGEELDRYESDWSAAPAGD
jgi:hypothetical protein